MAAEHSLTAAVVAVGGADGPRYYPASLSADGATALAREFRSTGVPAIAVPLHLRMPEPGPLLSASVLPRLFAVVHDDPCEMVEAEVLAAQEQTDADREANAGGGNHSIDAAEPDESDASDGAAEQFGDESTYIGWAPFERLLDQWTVWLAYVDQGSPPQLTSAFPTLDEAWKEAERWRNDPQCDDSVAIIVGPGDGPLSLSAITAWPNKWTIITAKETESGDGWTIDYGCRNDRDDFARKKADCCRNPSPGMCQVIVAPYQPAAKGGER